MFRRSNARAWTAVLFLPWLALCATARGQEEEDVRARRRPVLPVQPSDTLPEGALVRMGSVRLYASGAVTSLAYSPDGHLLAGVVQVRHDLIALQLWEASSGKSLHFLAAPAMGRPSFSADSKKVSLAGHTWNTATGEAVAKEPVDHPLDVSRDGQWRVYQNREPLELIVRPASKEEPISLRVEAKPNSIGRVRFSNDAKRLAVSTYEGKCQIWDIAAKRMLHELKLPQARLGSVVWSPDDALLAVANQADELLLFDTAQGTPKRSIRASRAMTEAAFSPDGSLLAAAGREEVRVWQVENGQPVRTIEDPMQQVNAMAFSPDGQQLAVGGGFAPNGNVRVWNARNWEESLTRTQAHRTPIRRLTFSATGNELMSAGQDKTIRLWNARTGGLMTNLAGDGSRQLVFSPDGWLMGAVGQAGLRLWEVETGDLILDRAFGDRGSWNGGTVSPDLAWHAQGEDDEIAVAEIAGAKAVRRYKPEPAGDVNLLAFSPNGKRLAMVSEIDTRNETLYVVRSVDAATGKDAREYKPPELDEDDREEAYEDLLYAPDGGTIAAKHQTKRVFVWDAASGKLLQQIEDVQGPMAFAGDGRWLATTNAEGAVKLWELASGQVAMRIPSGGEPVTALGVSPLGDKLAAAQFRTYSILVWGLAPQPGEDSQGEPKTAADLAGATGQKLWQALAGDAEPAHRAYWTLARLGEPAVLFLRGQLVAAAGKQLDPAVIRKLIAELDADEFEKRQQASARLREIGAAAHAELKLALVRPPSPESRTRIEALVRALENPVQRYSGEPLRRLRTIALLEKIGGKQAHEALTELAAGSPGASETRAAKLALSRFETLKKGR